MAVGIDVETQSASAVQLPHECVDGVAGGVLAMRGVAIATVEVLAASIGAVVAAVDAVWVEDRHELEDVTLAQSDRARVRLTQQK